MTYFGKALSFLKVSKVFGCFQQNDSINACELWLTNKLSWLERWSWLFIRVKLTAVKRNCFQITAPSWNPGHTTTALNYSTKLIVMLIIKKSVQWTVHTRTCALKHLYLHKNLIMSTFTVNRSYKCDPWGRQIQANRPHNNPFGSFHKILTRKCLKLLPKWYRCWLAFHDKDVLYQVLEHKSLCFNQCQLLTIRLFTYIAKADRYSILFIARYFQISLKRH